MKNLLLFDIAAAFLKDTGRKATCGVCCDAPAGRLVDQQSDERAGRVS
jgi:hypothetical protein